MVQTDPGLPPGQRVEPLHLAPSTRYRSLVRLSNVVIALLTVHVVFDVAALVVDVQMLGLLERIRDRGPATIEEFVAADERVFWSGVLQSGAELAVAVAIIAWLRRAYRNLGALGVRRLRFKPGWAVGGWFVPFLALARPKSILNDVWRASDPELPHDVYRPPAGAPVPRSFNWWWGFFLVGSWAYPVDLGSGTAPPSLGAAIFDVRRIAVGDASLIVAGILAIVVVRKTTQRQEQRRAALEAAGALTEEAR